jgi:hypothetical protein
VQQFGLSGQFMGKHNARNALRSIKFGTEHSEKFSKGFLLIELVWLHTGLQLSNPQIGNILFSYVTFKHFLQILKPFEAFGNGNA